MRFSPIQTKFAQELCVEYAMPNDLSTAVLIDEHGAYKESTAILRIFPHLNFPYNIIGQIGLLIPEPIRDAGYNLFAQNRGAIWKYVKKVTGIGNPSLQGYRSRMLGLEEEDHPLDPGWGFK